MSRNLLRNGGFEADWSEESSHRCLIFDTAGRVEEAERGNIFTPPGWLVWFRHGLPVEHDPANNVGWAQPEVRDAWIAHDPARVHSGQKGLLLFTFYRVHDGGLLQQVEVEPGTRLRLSAWAHAWSNSHLGPHVDDPRWSEGEGVGYEHFFAVEGAEGLDDEARNFTFWLGIDPRGGTDPYAETVVWGQGAHIYNAYRPVPPVEAVAQAERVTVFLRSRTLWPFKHNDAYWDDVHLRVVGPTQWVRISFEPPEPRAQQLVQVLVTSSVQYENTNLEVMGPAGVVPVLERSVEPPPDGYAWGWAFVPAMPGSYRAVFTAEGGAQRPIEGTLEVGLEEPVWGLPREPYARTYVLLPPGAGREWVEAILDSGAWDRRRWTIGGSADDAGIGALEDKTVIAVNPAAWPGDLEAFFRTYYPRTRYIAIEAGSPEELRRRLEEME